MSETILTKENFQKEVIECEKTVLIDFYADWCGPCKMLSPIIEEIAQEREDVKVCKVNVDNESELAVSFKVSSIPTLVVMKNGEATNVSVGYVPKEKILEML